MSERAVTCVVIGAGQRGTGYAGYARDFPDRLKVVGVADPREFHREKIQSLHDLPQDKVFSKWEDAAALEKFADCAIITTPDILHMAPAVAFAKKGYHILLEKPMAVSVSDCHEIVKACSDVILTVCHVLRYMPQSVKVRELIASGVIGDVVNIQLLEPVGFWHFAHSFVRGNWGNSKKSCFSLLAKSCHDIDLILYWLEDKTPAHVTSFGSLKHFKNSNKPAGAGSRCMDCSVEGECAYSAKKLYLDMVKMGRRGWPVSVVADVPDIENITEALKTGPYGRCVYESDNDVCDNQVVNIQFSDGTTASFTMIAFTQEICSRQARIFGTKGELTVDMSRNTIKHFDFLTENTVHHEPTVNSEAGTSRLQGHGGADFYAMDSFVSAVKSQDKSLVVTGAQESLESHLLVFASEEARNTSTVIDFQKWKQNNAG